MFKRLLAIKKKFELNIDGYYQLSRKQEVLWVLGLFVIAIIFSFIMELFTVKKYRFGVPTIAYTICLIISSFVMASPWLGFCIFTKKSKIVIYQIWTAFFVFMMIVLIFKIDLSRLNIFLQYTNP